MVVAPSVYQAKPELPPLHQPMHFSVRLVRQDRSGRRGSAEPWDTWLVLCGRPKALGFGKLKNLDSLLASTGRAIRKKPFSEALPPAPNLFHGFLPF